MKLCIVTCSKKKIWDKFPNKGFVKAKEAYIGNFAKACIEYAEKFYPNNYVILSAKYGFLYPDEDIQNYNVTFEDERIEELRKQAEEKGLMKYDEIIVLAGKKYFEIVKKVFEGKKIYEPLKGLRLGEKIHKIKEAINKEVEL